MFSFEMSSSDAGYPKHLLIFNGLFYAYMLGSFVGLGKWIAVQQLPTAIASPSNATGKSRKRKIIAGCVGLAVFVIVFSVTLAADLYGFEAWLEHYQLAAILLFFACMSYKVCLDWFCVPVAYHRTPEGGLRAKYKMAELPKWRRLLFRLAFPILAMGLPVGAIHFRSDACASAMLFVTMFVAQGHQCFKTNSLRKLIIGAAVYEVAILLYFGVIGAMIFQSGDKQILEDLDTEIGRGDWVYTFVLAQPLCRLFSTALRFDYARQIEVTATAAIAAETVPAPAATTPEAQLTTGVIAPSMAAVLRSPTGKHFYFFSALLAYLASHITVTTLIGSEVLPDLGRVVYTAYVLILATPLIVASFFTVAYVRGETKQLWKYEEIWTSTPVPTSAVPTTREGVADVTANEAIKEKDVLLVDA